MDIATLRRHFKAYLQKQYPNNNHIDADVSMAFFLDRYGSEYGIDFQQILTDGIILDSYELTLEKRFIARDSKNPRGNAAIYKRSLKLLLEYIASQNNSGVMHSNNIIVSHGRTNTASPMAVPHSSESRPIRTGKGVGNILVQIGKERFANRVTSQLVELTGKREYDTLLSDLTNMPHAFVLACLMDKQIKAERAWSIPCRIMDKWGTDINSLNAVSQEEYVAFFNRHSLHRFNNEMAKVFKCGVQRIVDYYNGDASLIWKGKPSSAKVVYDFLQFRGAGIKIATMAANILARQFQVEFADYYAIDVSPDVHIRRVMWRMGLIEDEANIDAVICRARELNPEFPGIIDFSAWEIGREYCKPNNPKCDCCSVKDECIKRLK